MQIPKLLSGHETLTPQRLSSEPRNQPIMVKFDKDIVEDPVDSIAGIQAPNDSREGPVVGLLNSMMQLKQGGSYHQQDPNTGHLSTSSGCQRRNYLKYVHKLDDSLEVPANDNNTNWTFSHGDAVHEMMQDMLLEQLGRKHVSIEETIEIKLGGEYRIYGHADIVIRGLSDPSEVTGILPGDVNLLPDGFNGFPDPFVIDIKTKSEFTYYNYNKKGHSRTIPKENNMMQLNGYMGALDASFGCLLYYSKRNDHMEEYWMNFDQDLFDEAKDNITLVLDAVNTGEPAPRNPGGDYMCKKFCKWYKQGKCPGMEGVKPHENWDGQSDDFVYDHPEWAH